MILLTMKMSVLSEKRKEFLQTVLAMTEPTRRLRGCRSYGVFQDVEHENVFSLIQEWDTQEDVNAHLRSDVFGALLGARSLLLEPPELRLERVMSCAGMEAVQAAREGGIG